MKYTVFIATLLASVAAAGENRSLDNEFAVHCAAARMLCDEQSRHRDYYEILYDQLPIQGRLLELRGELGNENATSRPFHDEKKDLQSRFLGSLSKRFAREPRFQELVNQARLSMEMYSSIPTSKPLTSRLMEDAVKELGRAETDRVFGTPWQRNPANLLRSENGRPIAQCKFVPAGLTEQRLLQHFHKIAREIEHYRMTHVNPFGWEITAIRMRLREPLYRQIAAAMNVPVSREIGRAKLGRVNYHDPKHGRLYGYVLTIIDDDTFLLKPRKCEAIYVHLNNGITTKTVAKLVGYEIRCLCNTTPEAQVAIKKKSPPTGYIVHSIIPSHHRQNLGNNVLQER